MDVFSQGTNALAAGAAGGGIVGMQTSTDRRVALVTGVGRGIGRATAVALARDGHAVVLGVRDPSSVAGMVDRLRSEALQVDAVRLDVTDGGTVDSATSRWSRPPRRTHPPRRRSTR